MKHAKRPFKAAKSNKSGAAVPVSPAPVSPEFSVIVIEDEEQEMDREDLYSHVLRVRAPVEQARTLLSITRLDGHSVMTLKHYS